MKLHGSSVLTAVCVASSIACLTFEDSTGITIQSINLDFVSDNVKTNILAASIKINDQSELAADTTWVDDQLVDFNIVPDVSPWLN